MYAGITKEITLITVLCGLSVAEALETMGLMYKVYLTDPKSQNKFVKTVTMSKKQEEILRKVNPMLLSKCSV